MGRYLSVKVGFKVVIRQLVAYLRQLRSLERSAIGHQLLVLVLLVEHLFLGTRGAWRVEDNRLAGRAALRGGAAVGLVVGWAVYHAGVAEQIEG